MWKSIWPKNALYVAQLQNCSHGRGTGCRSPYSSQKGTTRKGRQATPRIIITENEENSHGQLRKGIQLLLLNSQTLGRWRHLAHRHKESFRSLSPHRFKQYSINKTWNFQNVILFDFIKYLLLLNICLFSCHFYLIDSLNKLDIIQIFYNR